LGGDIDFQDKILFESFSWGKTVTGEPAKAVIWGADESIPLEERCKRAIAIFESEENQKELCETKLAMKYEFPRLPDDVIEKVIARAWSDNHVGTVKHIRLGVRCKLAVEAHVRYNETDFEKEWRENENEEDSGDYDDYYDRRYWRQRKIEEMGTPYERAWESVSNDIAMALAKYMFPLNETLPTLTQQKNSYQTMKSAFKNPLWKPWLEKGKAIIALSMKN
jgi:hypothetical protein